MCERDDRFGDTLQQAWNQDQPAETLAQLAAKLSSLGSALKHWGRLSFGSVRQELPRLWQQLTVLREDPTRVGPGEEEKRVLDQIVELSF